MKRWIKGGWKIEAKVPVAGDNLLALANGDHIALVTNRRVVDLKNGIQKATAYKSLKPLGPMSGWITSTLVTGTDVWIGRDAGEWGGSLERIDLATGISKNIQGNISDRPPDPNNLTKAPGPDFATQGPIITNVNALLTAPWNSHCILVAQGLIHFMASGEIVQVCDGKVLPFYRANLGDRQEVPFYGLAKASSGVVWAAGINGLYRITADGQARRTPMPHFTVAGGVAVNFITSDLALVLTEVHRRASVSGQAPMLVPLDEHE